jgi:hypothetical protein
MSNRAGREDVGDNGGSNLGSDEAMVERGFDRWLNRQLHRIYDPVLGEVMPDELLRLIERFDPKPQPPAEGNEEDRNQ